MESPNPTVLESVETPLSVSSDTLSLSTAVKEEQEKSEKMEKLNLFLQKQLYHMDKVLEKQQAKIKNLKEQLSSETKLRQNAEKKYNIVRKLVVQYLGEVGEMTKNLKTGNFPDKDIEEQNTNECLQAINLLSSEVHRWFSKCSKDNYEVRQEVAEMQANLRQLEQSVAASPGNTDSVEVITVEDTPDISADSINPHNSLTQENNYVNPRNRVKAVRVSCRKCKKKFATRKLLFAHHMAAHGCQMGKGTKFIKPLRFSVRPVSLPIAGSSTSTNATPGVVKVGSDGRYHGKDLSKLHLGLFCVCGHKYRYISSLGEHIGILTTEWRFQCQVCDKKFYRGSDLRHHMIKLHNGQPSVPTYACRRCDKNFRDFAGLIRHRRVNHRLNSNVAKSNELIDNSTPPPLSPHFNNEGSFQADSNPVEHHDFAPYKYNVNSRRFYCTCLRSFGSRKMLAYHIKETIVGKVFKCMLCSSAFGNHSNLKHHVAKSHRVPYTSGKFGCRDCGSTFHFFKDLMDHRLANHYTYSQE